MDINTTVLMAAESPTERLVTILVYGLMDYIEQYGVLLVFLAIVGAFALTHSTVRFGAPIFFASLVIFVITPYIVIRSMVDKEYGVAFSSEYISIKGYVKEHPKEAKKIFVRFGIYSIAVVVLVIAAFYLQYMM